MRTTPSASSRPNDTLVVAVMLTALAVATVVGIFLSVRLLSGTDARAAGQPQLFRVAQDVPTSFGFVAVEHAETLKGLAPRELGGATHGIGGFVGRDKALVQASVTITNTAAEPLAYSPAQFRVVSRSRRGAVERIPLAHASVRDGELQPDAALDARLSFVVPRDGSRLEVEFVDPARPEPLRILLDTRAGRLTPRDRAALAEGHATGAHDDGHDHATATGADGDRLADAGPRPAPRGP